MEHTYFLNTVTHLPNVIIMNCSFRMFRFLQMCSDDGDTIPPLEADFATRQLHDINWIVSEFLNYLNLF